MRCNVITITLILSLMFVSSCFGDEAVSRYKIGYQAENGGRFGAQICVTGLEGASKGFEDEDAWPSTPTSGVLLGIRKVNGIDEWNGITGFYGSDGREMLSPGQSVTVEGIYMWAVPGTPNQDMHLRLMSGLYMEPGVSFTLSLVSIPQGIEYSGSTTWGAEASEIALPFYSTDNGEDGYKFRLVISASQ